MSNEKESVITPESHLRPNYGLRRESEFRGRLMDPRLASLAGSFIQMTSGNPYPGTGIPDVTFNLRVMLSIYSEALHQDEFFTVHLEHDFVEQDRLALIAFHEYIFTRFGFLTINDIIHLRALKEPDLLNVLRNPDVILDPLLLIRPELQALRVGGAPSPSRIRLQDYKVNTVAQRLRELPSNKTVGIFHGSFDPLHVIHLAQAYYYRQFCETLLIGIDNTAFIQNTKGRSRMQGRVTYTEQQRILMWKYFPHIADDIVILPMKRPNPPAYTEMYKALGVHVLFFHPDDPNADLRRMQIERANGQAFTHTPIPNLPISSSTIMAQYIANSQSLSY